MVAKRRIKILNDGRNQLVRIPRGFELEGEEAVLGKAGDQLIIEPSRSKSLLTVLARLEPLEESLPP